MRAKFDIYVFIVFDISKITKLKIQNIEKQFQYFKFLITGKIENDYKINKEITKYIYNVLLKF